MGAVYPFIFAFCLASSIIHRAAMNLRHHNIYFHTHTISGIIVCGLLYVIFFAGSFSFFKDEISAWQHNASYRQHEEARFPYGKVLDSLDREYDLRGRNISVRFFHHSPRSLVNISPSQDTVNNKKAQEQSFFYYDYLHHVRGSYTDFYDLGEFLYRLHFLAQLNPLMPFQLGYPFGYLVAGLVSFLFLFALITGLLLHWKKIVSNFFLFRPWSKLKTAWTDLHTVLGVIGFPYQLVFAVTGLILIVNTVFLAPFSKLLYEGDREKTLQALEYSPGVEAEYTGRALAQIPDIDSFVERTQAGWSGAFIKQVIVKNYGDGNMQLVVTADAARHRSFAGTGQMVYRPGTAEVLSQKSPYEGATYIDKIKSIVYRLHFGDYGGYYLKIVYFIMGIMGCMVIASGIIIWLVARDKNAVPAYKRKFNYWLANVYLAACLSMFPVTALTFIMVKINVPVNQSFIYQVYLYSWLLLSVYYILRRDLNRTNRETLLLGAVFSVCVPLANGLCTGNWPWVSFSSGAHDILLLDLMWLGIGLVACLSYLKIRTRRIEDIKLKKERSRGSRLEVTSPVVSLSKLEKYEYD